jgi:hypothetical protein
MAQAGLNIWIARPINAETNAAHGGVFTISGKANAWTAGMQDDPVTNVEVFRNGSKLGTAIIAQPVTSPCNWCFPWTNVVSDSCTLSAKGYSSLSQKISSAITASFYTTSNAAPVAELVHARVPMNATNYAIPTLYTDADLDQSWSAQVVTPPLRGSVSNIGLYSTVLYYTPTNGFGGMDSFSYRISDGQTNSSPAICQVFVNATNHPAGETVLLLMNSNLVATAVSNAIWRLKNDLELENYAVQIKLWPASGSSASNVWSFLRENYTNTTQFLAGAILIGNIPRPQSGANTNELVYWNLRFFQTNDLSVDNRQIWVSRISVDDTTWGSETTLLVRALDANHAYRRGESRLPFTAYRYKIPEWARDFTNNYLSTVWPVVERRGESSTNLTFLPSRTDLGHIDAADCMVKGGELFEEESHGNQSGYMSIRTTSGNAWVTKTVLHRNLVQTRVVMLGSCDVGQSGGVGNEHLFTRGGGCVLVISPSSGSGTTEATISGSPSFLDLLKTGPSWGDALVENWAVGLNRYAILSGDLSLRPMASVYSNAMPVISGFTASSTNTSAGLAVNFSVATSDPDGVISNIEWFLTGFNGGKASPTFIGTATNLAYVYGTPGTYTARVEAMDNYQARVWREMTINVSTAIPYRVTVTKSGNGWSSFGTLSPATRTVPPGGTTQIVFTAADWYRIQTLASNNVTVGVAAGRKTYTQALVNVTANISNHVAFALATPEQTGYTNVPIAWLTNWAENALISDPAFDVYEKYLLGLDPTTSNTFSLMIESFGVFGSHFVTVLKRAYSGGLSPDGMHGQLELQTTDRLDSPFTNIAATAVTGATVFDGAGRKTYTNVLDGANRFIRAVIH